MTISANGDAELVEVDEDEFEPVPEPELPRLPAVVEVAVPVDELDDDPVLDVLDVEALDVDPADIESPGERLESDTIVPLIGA